MAAKLQVRPALIDDADWFATRLRQSDHDEAVAAAGPDVLGTLRRAIRYSEGLCWVAERDSRGVLLLGCAPIDMAQGHGSPWLVGTGEAVRFPGALTRIAKRHIAIMRGAYPHLINLVDDRNEVSIRWLQRLGFTMADPAPGGVNGELFRRFTMGA